MTKMSNECAIWHTPASPHHRAFASDPPAAWIDDSPRAGGAYAVHLHATGRIARIDDPKRIKLTTWLIDERAMGADYPMVTTDTIDRMDGAVPLPIEERAQRLLALLAMQSQAIGQRVEMALPEDPSVRVKSYPTLEEAPESVRNLWRAMAWSESTTINEVRFLIEYLAEKGWLKRDGREQPESVSLTVEGYAQIEDSRVNAGRTQAFVAMWFAEEMNGVFERGIQPGIQDAGYTAMRIDRKEHINKIDDEIVAEIRRSRFLVADYSQDEAGARGGVYWEDGFASGLGLQVIRTCRKDCIDQVAFDTRQYNHILWETPNELRAALANRIMAAIDGGPTLSPDRP